MAASSTACHRSRQRPIARQIVRWIIGSKDDDIVAGSALDLLKYYRALRIVGGIVADKHKRAVQRFDDAHWVFPSVEPGNLCHQWTICRNIVIAQEFSYLSIRQFAVLRRKRI